LNYYEGKYGSQIRVLDVIRLIVLIIIFSSYIFRIIQKYRTYPSGFTVFIKVFLIVTFQVKHIILLSSIGFYIAAFVYFSSSTTQDSVIQQLSQSYFDFYTLAVGQRSYSRYDVISFYLISIYVLKYFQLLTPVQLLFVALKKAAFELSALVFTVAILFIGLSILTCFVYGAYIFEYKTFVDSLCSNIKIFIFQEDTYITFQFLKFYRAFSIIVLLIFIFLIRFFLLNLFYPIIIEYSRLEFDKLESSKGGVQTDDTPTYTVKQSKLFSYIN